MITTILAIYSAILATVLGGISIANFVRDRKILRVEKHVSFTLDEAFYDFVISNVSSRPFTIVECTIVNLAQTESGRFEPDWGIQPDKLQSLFGERNEGPVELPYTLHPGQLLIVGICSSEILNQFFVKFSDTSGYKELDSNGANAI